MSIFQLCPQQPGLGYGNIEGDEGRKWVKIKIIEEDGSDDPKNGIKDVNVKITLADKTREVVSGPGGVISFVDIDPDNFSVGLNEDEGSDILEITDR